VDVAQVAPAADEAGTGWYLDRVVVTPPGGGGGGGSPASPAPSITFPCGAWFGSNEEAVAGASAADAVVSARALVPRGAGPAPGAAATPSRPAAAPAATASLAFDCGGAAVPHPEKVAASGAKATCRAAGGWAGEDAYFVERLPGGGAALGVSDGVWMWRLHGIDAGAFSRALMRHAAAAVAAGETDPASALATAEACTLGAGVRGSATACIVTLDAAGGALAAANVGDSGFAVAGAPPYAGGGGGRHDQGQTSSSPSPAHRRVVKFRSPQQEHEFGRPYQLGHHPGADRASAAMRTALPLAPGDVIILGSDGLWDNLDDDGLLAAIAESDAAREPAAALARRLTAAAFDGSVDRKRSTPYSVAATEELGMVYSGGKADDITVVCARVRGVGR
jgi:protein phosphatase PTC7